MRFGFGLNSDLKKKNETSEYPRGLSFCFVFLFSSSFISLQAKRTDFKHLRGFFFFLVVPPPNPLSLNLKKEYHGISTGMMVIIRVSVCQLLIPLLWRLLYQRHRCGAREMFGVDWCSDEIKHSQERGVDFCGQIGPNVSGNNKHKRDNGSKA